MTETREQFFLHVSGIAEGPAIPKRGSIVEFEVAPAFKNGKLPVAINAKILPEVRS